MDDTKQPPGGASAATAKEITNREQPIPYATSGEVFTNWLNRRLSEKGNVQIPLGTKKATVNRLLPDGRLECEVPDAEGLTSETQHVAFDETKFDLLLPKLANI
ncbi:MAG: hypothetical protein LC803_16715 [Acidobacteria bacterium]|nr:hypothetical protein [Acidobacteriota bacterium]